MKKLLFILTFTFPIFIFSQILKELSKVEIPKIEVFNLKTPEIKIPILTNIDLLKTKENSVKYFLLTKKPESTELYTIMVKKPVENVEKILIAKPK